MGGPEDVEAHRRSLLRRGEYGKYFKPDVDKLHDLRKKEASAADQARTIATWSGPAFSAPADRELARIRKKREEHERDLTARAKQYGYEIPKQN